MSLAGLLWKDRRVEWRGKEGLQAGLVLVALFFLVQLFAIDSLAEAPRLATVGLWMPLLFASIAAVGRGLAGEADRGTLGLLRTLPVPPALHGVSRTLLGLVLVLFVIGVELAIAHLVFGLPVDVRLVATLALAAVGITVVTTLASGLAAQARAREILLPILAVPVLAPLVQAGIEATTQVLERGDPMPALYLMLGYDLLAIGLAFVLWPAVLDSD